MSKFHLIKKTKNKKTKPQSRLTRELNSFYKTDFSFDSIWKMLASFVALYIVAEIIVNGGIQIYAVHARPIKASMGLLSSLTLLSTFMTELIPIALVGLYFGMRGRGHVCNRAWQVFKKWVKRLFFDLVRHWDLILLGIVLIFIAQILVSQATSAIFMHGQATGSTNNSKIVKAMMKKNILTIFFTSLIAPLAEELFFRFFLTRFLAHWLYKAWHGHVQLAFWVGAVFSAVFFASMHLQGQSFIMSGTYIVSALIFQWLMVRTRSVTAPVLVHSASNLAMSALMFV